MLLLIMNQMQYISQGKQIEKKVIDLPAPQ